MVKRACPDALSRAQFAPRHRSRYEPGIVCPFVELQTKWSPAPVYSRDMKGDGHSYEATQVHARF